jgi:hypothetical protein
MWWNIRREDDGSFTIWVDGDEARPLRAFGAQLERQLAGNGVVCKWYEDVVEQLSRENTARVRIPKLGQFSHVG